MSLSTENSRNVPTLLVLGQFSPLVVHKALRIDKPYPFPSLLLWETLKLEETQQLLSDTNTSGPSAKEKNSLFTQRETGGGRRELCRVDETRENNRPGS